MEEKLNKEEWRREAFKEETGMTFEQLKDKYNYHYDNINELRHAYGFMKANMYIFFKDKKADGFMILLQAAKYLADCVDLEHSAFRWLSTALWGKWDTDNYDLDHEIFNLYDLACAQEDIAKELLEAISNMCGEACHCYMFKHAKFTDDEMHDAMKKVLDYPKYHFDVPEKPKFDRETYSSKYFSHKEDQKCIWTSLKNISIVKIMRQRFFWNR